MERKDCKVWTINDKDVVAGENELQVIKWYERFTKCKVDVIVVSSLREQYVLPNRDGANITEGFEVWKTVSEGIKDYFKHCERLGKSIEEPFIVCGFDD